MLAPLGAAEALHACSAVPPTTAEAAAVGYRAEADVPETLRADLACFRA